MKQLTLKLNIMKTVTTIDMKTRLENLYSDVRMAAKHEFNQMSALNRNLKEFARIIEEGDYLCYIDPENNILLNALANEMNCTPEKIAYNILVQTDFSKQLLETA